MGKITSWIKSRMMSKEGAVSLVMSLSTICVKGCECMYLRNLSILCPPLTGLLSGTFRLKKSQISKCPRCWMWLREICRKDDRLGVSS